MHIVSKFQFFIHLYQSIKIGRVDCAIANVV